MATGLGSRLLRRSVFLSFVLGTLALTWYAADMYHGMYVHRDQDHGNGHGHGHGHDGHQHHRRLLEETIASGTNNSNINTTSSNNNSTVPSRASEVRGSYNRISGSTESSNNNSSSSSSSSTETPPTINQTTPASTSITPPTNSSTTLPWDAIKTIVYATGTTWWIVVCLLAYLGPLVAHWRPRYNTVESKSKPKPAPSIARWRWHYLTANLRRRLGRLFPTTRKLVMLGLVAGPSLWLFLYGTIVGIPSAKRRILGNNGDTEDTELGVFGWASVLVMATAMPAGTAGCVSMGVYVFGTVARHSPLWSAYVVLPDDDASGSSNHNNKNGSQHANLMMDALRLHQWSGILTFWWFFLHTILYCIIYGFAGLQKHAADLAAAAAAANATNITATANATANATAATAAASTASIFWGSVWTALVPPPECRPILGGEDRWNRLFHHSSEGKDGRAASSTDNTTFTKHGRSLKERKVPELYRVLGEDLYFCGSHDRSGGYCEYTARRVLAETSDDGSHNNHTESRDGNTTTANATADKHGPAPRNPCYGYYRNFHGFLAILACLFLVLTSLNFVRRASYRFFYVSHLLLATIFVLTMIFHMKRISIYLMPSLLCYAATTIPTLVQALAGAIRDGGVDLTDCTVLAKKHQGDSGKDDDTINDEGVVDMVFLVERDATGNNYQGGERIITHRPKSVRICVPSISLLWYPFTVIEQQPTTPVAVGDDEDSGSSSSNNNDLVECRILFGTVGYFTKSLMKKLYQLQLDEEQYRVGVMSDPEQQPKLEEEDNDDDVFLDEDSGNTKKSPNAAHHRRQQQQQPLLLIDGFYSGASDWIASALSHDVVLIAAGGTGVTPFLTFLPKLLMALEQEHASRNPADLSNDWNVGLESFCGVGSNRNPSISASTTVSFLWCCRDEALIQHVVNTYLIQLFQSHPTERNHDGCILEETNAIRVRLMIYNTSRDPSDTNPLDLGSRSRQANRDSCGANPRPMRPFKLQHHPSSSKPRAVFRAMAFLSIVLVGIQIHRWSADAVLLNRHNFAVRAYGLLAIFVWSAVVGILAELAWRWAGSAGCCFRGKSGRYAVANGGDEDEDDAVSPDSDPSEENTQETGSHLGGPHLASLTPRRFYSLENDGEGSLNDSHRPILELSLSNGRPSFGPREDEDDSATPMDVSPSEKSLQQVVTAARPGVFYCGPTSLLGAIKTRVEVGRDERRRLCARHDNNDDGAIDEAAIEDCTYYEESFEM